jgi:hypothetical protein
MSTATPALAREPARRPPPGRCCTACGSAILGYVQTIEICRLTHRGPDMEHFVACADCADAVRQYLRGSCSPPPASRRSPS